MPNRLRLLDRRRAIALLASLSVLGRAGKACAVAPAMPLQSVVPPKLRNPVVLMPGPSGGPIERWARLIEPGLAQSVAPGTAFRQTVIGGADGVTAANRFEARGTLDGLTLLMAPGEAALAWLVGDPRAKFDVSRWVAVVTTMDPAVVVGRPGALRTGGPVRIAAGGLGGPDLPALLGIELLGARAVPVHGLADLDAVSRAFAQNKVDAVLLRGHHVPKQMAAMAAAGMRPLFCLGFPGASGGLVQPVEFPGVPPLDELYRRMRGSAPSGALFSAWRAAAIASQLEFGLVLPELTPAPMVALWRQAGVQAMAALDIQALAASLAIRPMSGPAATVCGDLWSPPAPALLALRQWLAERYHWRPL